jgi:NAD dependent epimerase/dehydratase family enzyme
MKSLLPSAEKLYKNKLFKYFNTTNNFPEVVISGSAVGYYGPQGDSLIDEEMSHNDSYTNHL